MESCLKNARIIEEHAEERNVWRKTLDTDYNKL